MSRDLPLGPDLPSIAELLAAWLEENALLANPLPVCTRCGFPFVLHDAGMIFKDECASCETGHIEDLVHDLVEATDRASTLRALEAIHRLAM